MFTRSKNINYTQVMDALSRALGKTEREREGGWLSACFDLELNISGVGWIHLAPIAKDGRVPRDSRGPLAGASFLGFGLPGRVLVNMGSLARECRWLDWLS